MYINSILETTKKTKWKWTGAITVTAKDWEVPWQQPSPNLCRLEFVDDWGRKLHYTCIMYLSLTLSLDFSLDMSISMCITRNIYMCIGMHLTSLMYIQSYMYSYEWHLSPGALKLENKVSLEVCPWVPRIWLVEAPVSIGYNQDIYWIGAEIHLVGVCPPSL